MKKLFIFLFFLIVFVAITNLVFENKVNDLELNIPKIEANEMIKMESEKNFWVTKFKKDYPRLRSYYIDSGNNKNGKIDFNDAIIQKDTLITFLFKSKKIAYKSFDLDYFNCLYNHEVNRYNNINNKEYLSWLSKTRKKFGLSSKTLNNLINIIKQSSSSNSNFPFSPSISVVDKECKKCVPNYISVSNLDAFSTKEFDSFIKDYFINNREIDKNNSAVLKKYNSKFQEYRRNMTYSLISKLNTKLKTNPVISEKKINYNFLGSNKILGSVTYSFIKKEYNEKSFDKIGNDVYRDFYSNNSLRNGSQPYSYCYGSNSYCSPPKGYNECSFIDIRSSGNSDVVVIIKKNNRVYSHAYIKANGYYKFKLGNGNFQTFFYYGKGWNPNKYIKTANCGEIVGGFVSNESLDKSEFINLYYSSMTYTLYSVNDGNFSPKPRNKNEAF